MKLARLMWKNATRNPRRTILTILSIAVSIFLVSSLQAILDRLDMTGRASDSSHLRLVVHRATSMTQPLPVAYKQRIAAVPGVKYVGSLSWFGGLYIDERNFFANFAADPEYFEKIYDENYTPPEQLAAWKADRTGALVGKKLMEKYGWKIGDKVTLKGTIYPVNVECTISAVYTSPDDAQMRAFFFHWDYFNELLGRRDQVGSIAVKAATPEDVPRVMDAIDRMFRNTDAETKTETEQAFNLSFVSMLGNVKFLLNAISLAVVFTILLVAGNTMAMSIRERTGEVAVLKTLGFRRNTILALLVGESALIALLGGLFGALGAKLAYAFIHATSLRAVLRLNLGPFPLEVSVYAFVFAVGVTLLAGYGAWLLFAGASASRGWMKLTRMVATTMSSFIAFLAGFVFYFVTGFVMNQGGLFADFRVSIATIALCLAIAAVVGILSAGFPALRASRTSIAEALRYVG